MSGFASPSPPSVVGSLGIISRTEYIRLLQQALVHLGTPQAALALSRETNVPVVAHASASALRACILEGDYAQALAIADSRSNSDDKSAPFPWRDATCALEASLQILQAQYFALLADGKLNEALALLQTQITPMCASTPRLTARAHRLATLALCRTPRDLARAVGLYADATNNSLVTPSTRSQAALATTSTSTSTAAAAAATTSAAAAATSAWDHAAARRKLLEALRRLAPPGVMEADGRLEELLEIAVAARNRARVFVSARAGVGLSLFDDPTTGIEDVPSRTRQLLEEHDDEVWYLSFRHDGRMLATASKDGTVALWRIRLPELSEVGAAAANNDPSTLPPIAELACRLRGHDEPVPCVSWSPDGKYLVTCCEDNDVFLWAQNTDDDTGGSWTLRQRCRRHTDKVMCVAWFPDSMHFVTGSTDRTMVVWDINGKAEYAHEGLRVNDVAISRDGSRLVIISSNNKIHVLDMLALNLFPEGSSGEEKQEQEQEAGQEEEEEAGGVRGGEGSDRRRDDDDEGPPSRNSSSPEPSDDDDNDIPAVPMSTGEDKDVIVWPTSSAELVVTEPHAVTSICLSRCGRYLLAHLSSQKIHLHDLGSTPLARSTAAARGEAAVRAAESPTRIFSAHPRTQRRGCRYVLRACFGGACEELVASGGEDGIVYLWSRMTGELVYALHGHAGSVNAVAWCPATPHLFASASDDCTVRLWV
ncbi:hypothetical protein PPROV_000901700 [Pycnococcus provasolii]|uniref:Ig-like domain-containing protein n=2 Tax=Pycnococcus provasolii TaxID=41880 RepID=A0A830HS39_9CHLO|nr:hypothetical protein PPROV_000901700 [Pycnococcus provasolii]